MREILPDLFKPQQTWFRFLPLKEPGSLSDYSSCFTTTRRMACSSRPGSIRSSP